jgi:hypothetical protein
MALYPARALERAMKIKEVISRAMSGEIKKTPWSVAKRKSAKQTGDSLGGRDILSFQEAIITEQ